MGTGQVGKGGQDRIQDGQRSGFRVGKHGASRNKPSKMDVAPWEKHRIKRELDGFGLYSMVFLGIQWYSMVFVGIHRNP